MSKTAMKHRIISNVLLLALIPVLCGGIIGTPLTATAAGTATRTSTLDVRSMATTRNDVEGWSWNKETQTLTLDGVNIAAENHCAIWVDSATIILNGTNTVKSTYDGRGIVTSGIYSQSGDLIISGDGSLTVTGENSRGESCGIRSSLGKITINGGSITAIGGETSNGSSLGVFSHGLTLNDGSLTAIGGDSSGGGNMTGSYGVRSYSGDIVVNGGYLKATGGSSYNSNPTATAGVHIYRSGNIILANGVKITTPPGGYASSIDSVFDSPIKTIVAPSNPSVAAKEVIIKSDSYTEPPTPKLTAPVISLSTGTTIREGTSTTIKWNAVPAAVTYVIGVIDTATYKSWLTKETRETSYTLSSMPKGSYLITVYAKDSNSIGSDLSNTIKLKVANDECVDGFILTPVIKTFSESVEKGSVRYICQTNGSKYKYSKYWVVPENATAKCNCNTNCKHCKRDCINSGEYCSCDKCSTCCISMALSFLGLNYTPANLRNLWNDSSCNWAKTDNSVGLYYHGGTTKDFEKMFEDYNPASNRSIPKYSPIIVWLKGLGHYVLVVEKTNNANEYLAVDPFATIETSIVRTLTITKVSEGNYTIEYLNWDGKTKITDKNAPNDRFYQYYFK